MIFEGQLEIDEKRGVIYFHDRDSGHSVLRISGLPVPIPTPNCTPCEASYMLDINPTAEDVALRINWKGVDKP